MHVRINGDSTALEDGLTVALFLAQRGLAVERVAVELNRAVLPKAQHPTTLLKEGDEVELVTFVGGG